MEIIILIVFSAWSRRMPRASAGSTPTASSVFTRSIVARPCSFRDLIREISRPKSTAFGPVV
jgi:hypothetical protein